MSKKWLRLLLGIIAYCIVTFGIMFLYKNHIMPPWVAIVCQILLSYGALLIMAGNGRIENE
jgi:hypothetical protein